MESIKRFLLEERASSEAVSSVILIAIAAALLSVGLLAYWGAFNRIFEGIAGWLDLAPIPTTWTPG
jgi:hypothetical protein